MKRDLITYGVPVFVNILGTCLIKNLPSNENVSWLIAGAVPILSYATGLWVCFRLFNKKRI